MEVCSFAQPSAIHTDDVFCLMFLLDYSIRSVSYFLPRLAMRFMSIAQLILANGNNGTIFHETCTGVCYNDWVLGPPSNYDDAYFEIQHVRVYGNSTTSTPSSSSSSSSPSKTALTSASSASPSGSSSSASSFSCAVPSVTLGAVICGALYCLSVFL